MIDVKFAVETKDGNWFENINSIEECFEHNVKKIYETTFGGIKTMQVLVYSNSENKYCFNFMNVKTYKNGAYKGICPVCKTVVYSREHSQKETLMRIIKQ